MSFIAKSLFNYFFQKKNQKIPAQNNYQKNNTNQLQNLFKTKNSTKETKIFSTSDKETEKKQKPKIFSFINNEKETKEINNNFCLDNEYPKRIFFNEFANKTTTNYNKNKDFSLGINFNGIGNIKSDNQNCIFTSISVLPEFSYSSSEELRLADLEKLSTGNIKFYKIRNTSKESNNFSEENINENGLNYNLYEGNNLFNDDILFKKQNILFSNNQINLNLNNENNIFNKKFDNSKSPFANLINNNKLFNINYNQNSENNFFKSNNSFFNKNESNNNKTFFTYNKNLNQSTNITYSFPSQSFLDTSENSNISNNNQNNKISNEEASYPLNDLYINKLFSQKENLSKILNEAIKKEKSVKDFLIDLDKEYRSNKNSDIRDITNNLNYEDKNLDNGITLSQKNYNYNYKNNLNDFSPMKITKEIPCYKMELDLDENKDEIKCNNSCSKIKQIYNEYEKIKNDFNRANLLGNKTYKKSYENFFENKRKKIDKNENNFSKTFSNGFPKFNSQNIHNKILLGRNESLYNKNLMEIERLSINNIDNFDNKINTNFKKEKENRLSINKNENNSLNNDNLSNLSNKSLSISNISLRDSLSTISRKIVDIIIEYNLPEGKNNLDKIYLSDINLLMKVKSLKEKIISKINNELFINNYQNKYSIANISLLIPTKFLKDEEYLINCHLRSNNYTIHAIISYKKNIQKLINENLAPKLDKKGYECFPSISELKNKTCEELKKINNFKIYNNYGEVEFKEPINLLGVNLNDEVIIEKNMFETKDKLNYWSIFKIYEFIEDEGNISIFKKLLNENNGKFISYKNKELIWEYKPKSKK